MTKYFLTKVWGYSPQTWPVLGFGTKGGVNKLQREYSTGDWIVLAGTQSEPTLIEDQGRLLGLIQVTNTIVDVEPVLENLGTILESKFYNKRGEFRWPQGFPYLKAKAFTDKPPINVVLPDRNGRQARAEAAYAILLTDNQMESILKLPTEEVNFPLAPILEKNIRLNHLLTSSGPSPSLGEKTSSYADGKNWVYVFKIINTNFYKIGRSNDIERRLNEFNTSPHSIWSERPFEVVNTHAFPNAVAAHEVEQMLHEHLEQYAVGHECFVIPRENIAIAALGNIVYEYSLKT